MIKDWKLKLRYGKVSTPFTHYTLIAPTKIEIYIEEFDADIGTAWVGMKIWATEQGESAKVYKSVAEQIGLIITGNIEIYNTEAVNPPKDKPYAYDIQFTYFND
jgi:hypothetical protein